MPRRPADILEKVPLFLIPTKVRQKIGTVGEELERIVVKKVGRHFYNIAVHSRSVKRELRAEPVWAGKSRAGGAGT